MEWKGESKGFGDRGLCDPRLSAARRVASSHIHTLTHIVLALGGEHFIAVSQQDVHQAQPHLVTGGFVQQVGTVGELSHLLLLVIVERNN